jgi:hypothetical protein
MKTLLIASLLLAARLAGAQRMPTLHTGLVVRVQSADASQPASLKFSIKGHMYTVIGVDRDGSGRVDVGNDSGSATGEIFVDLTDDAGELTFESDRPGRLIELRLAKGSDEGSTMLFARGGVVRIARDASGVLTASAERPRQ